MAQSDKGGPGDAEKGAEGLGGRPGGGLRGADRKSCYSASESLSFFLFFAATLVASRASSWK